MAVVPQPLPGRAAEPGPGDHAANWSAPTFTDEGLRAALELRRTHPGTAVLVLSQYIETRYAAELLRGID